MSAPGRLEIERVMGPGDLAEFRQGGRAAIPQGQLLLLFLHYYPVRDNFQIGPWDQQFHRSPDGAPAPVEDRGIGFIRKHRLVRSGSSRGTAGSWDRFVEEVRKLARGKRRR